VLRRNLTTLGVGEVAVVIAEPVQRVLLRPAATAVDLVLADPPYDITEDDLADVLALLPRHGWLAPEALVVVERSSRSPQPRWPADLVSVDERRYGETRVWWARRAGDPEVA
jgi:16S rRNA (guanine966-N2)-methyltransferase